jgi:hypothetical protein
LVEAEYLVGPREKNFQNFPHHNTWLTRKICLALQKKISKFSAPPEFPEAEFLLSLE